ncbi:hypothetical protein B0J11DRAFT_581459 [Dendryphion nanum]|uniref:Uncharacterized protein n=1 Tax=Dendryphion nanum TaxID=256645 RepID=A0A9P9II00_9PLEO|nr:hypothetical protein B0J11DRAFT_581459 [Dendryphion nanum]
MDVNELLNTPSPQGTTEDVADASRAQKRVAAFSNTPSPESKGAATASSSKRSKGKERAIDPPSSPEAAPTVTGSSKSIPIRNLLNTPSPQPANAPASTPYTATDGPTWHSAYLDDIIDFALGAKPLRFRIEHDNKVQTKMREMIMRAASNTKISLQSPATEIENFKTMVRGAALVIHQESFLSPETMADVEVYRKAFKPISSQFPDQTGGRSLAKSYLRAQAPALCKACEGNGIHSILNPQATLGDIRPCLACKYTIYDPWTGRMHVPKEYSDRREIAGWALPGPNQVSSWICLDCKGAVIRPSGQVGIYINDSNDWFCRSNWCRSKVDMSLEDLMSRGDRGKGIAII